MQATMKIQSKNDADAHICAIAGEVYDHEDFEVIYGAHPDDLQAAANFVQLHGMTVVSASSPKREVVVEGTLEQMNRAFAVALHEHDGYQHHNFPARIPVHCNVEAVLGLSTKPVARPYFKKSVPDKPKSLTPLQVAALYDFPAGTGAGQVGAIVELGGSFSQDDFNSYIMSLGLVPPAVTVIGTQEAPGGDADGEVMLDVEIMAAVAPKSQILVFFVPNTSAGFVQAITDAAHHPSKPSVISISWGGPEADWSKNDLTAMSNAIRDAALLGVTVTVAAGDNGSTDGDNDRRQHVDYPGSDPNAVCCGGTRLEGVGSTITRETVWNDGKNGGATGGGVSDVFAIPAYQAGHSVPVSVNPGHFKGRGVPDIAGNADPDTGYFVRVDGQTTVVGGTSAVAPLVAGFFLKTGLRLGAPHTQLYALKSGFNDITVGNNGAFSASPGWDRCTGLGSLKGTVLAKGLA